MTVEELFWKWFQQNEEVIFHFEEDRERIFDQLSEQLQEVDANLTFEFGPSGPMREFVISAGGIRASFPAVVALKNAAPSLPRWNVTAFRPRRFELHTIEFRGKNVDPRDVEFSLLDNGQLAGLYLFVPRLSDEDLDYKVMGYLLLDAALGEYDVETGIGFDRDVFLRHSERASSLSFILLTRTVRQTNSTSPESGPTAFVANYPSASLPE